MRPWAFTMVYNWETKHTVINGERLYFDGTAVGLFGNWIKWLLLTIITFGIYGLWVGIKLKKWRVMDVREREEYASGHLPGAIHEPLSTIQNTTLPRNKPIFLYCLHGSRSRRAAGILKKMGYGNVKSIYGISMYKGTIE